MSRRLKLCIVALIASVCACGADTENADEIDSFAMNLDTPKPNIYSFCAKTTLKRINYKWKCVADQVVPNYSSFTCGAGWITLPNNNGGVPPWQVGQVVEDKYCMLTPIKGETSPLPRPAP